MKRAARGREVSDNIDTRVGVIETRIDGLDHTLHKVVQTLEGVKEALVSAPRAIPFKEIIVSISVTLGVVMMIGQVMASWHSLANKNLNYRIEQLEKHFHLLGKKG